MNDTSTLSNSALLMDPIMIHLVSAAMIVLVIGFLLRKFKQPALVGYILAGILLGPDVLGIFTDLDVLNQMGSVGVVLLLFFIGLEVSPREFLSNWQVAIIGTLIQVLASVVIVLLIGFWLGWSIQQIILIGFVISLSCTAVVINYLKDRGQHNTRIAKDMLTILIAQDIFVVPMLIIVGTMTGGATSLEMVAMQVIGGSAVVAFTLWLVMADKVHLPFARLFRQDQELQFFAAFLLCFGMASITGFFHLSTALGAFLAGMYVGQARETEWVKDQLDSFRVVFVAIFFASIGMMIDLDFTRQSWLVISLLVLVVLFTNSIINALILMGIGRSVKESLFAGALMAHVGEFSFVLAAIGWQTDILNKHAYQLSVSVIALSLLLAPIWASGCRVLIGEKPQAT